MNSGIATALIGAGSSILVGILAFIGVVITNRKANRDLVHKLETAQAVSNAKMEDLTREVRKHNSFAERIPVLEEKIKVVNHRVDDLEHKN